MDLTAKDAARMLNVSEDKIHSWIHNGTLPSYRVKDRYRLNRVELLEWAAERGIKVAPEFFRERQDSAGELLLADALARGGVLSDVPCTDKSTALQEVCARLKLPPQIDREELHSVLVAREALCSTGIGSGVAIPHPRGPIVLGLSEPYVTLAFLRQPVDYRALDKNPVSILFVIISTTVHIHLTLLSHLMYALQDPEFRGLLDRRAGEPEIHAKLAQVEHRVVLSDKARGGAVNELGLALALLGGGAIVSTALARWPRAALALALGCIGVAGAACCFAAVRALVPGSMALESSLAWPLPIGAAALAIDGLSAWFLLAIGIVSAAVAIYSWGYFEGAAGREPVWAAGALLCVLVAALILTIAAADVVLFLVGWELMSLSAFLLVGFHHRDAQTRRGAWTYLIATHLGTALGVLPVFGVLAARAGTTAFAAFPAALAGGEPGACVGLFMLGLLGFGTKAGIMPMHVWLPEAHPVAPSPVSALLSGVVIKTGVYGLLRLLTWLPPLPRACGVAVVAIAVITGVMGIISALAQRQYKRMLAYSSIENIGIIALAIGLGMIGRSANQPVLAVLGFGGALLHVLNHALFKGLLFLSAGAVLHGSGVDDVERLGGLARRDPRNAWLFAVGCAAICALPPLNGFVGEFLIYSGLLRGAMSGSLLVSAVAMVGAGGLALIGGLALAGFSKLFGVIFLGSPRDETVHAHPTPASMLAGMSVLAALCVLAAVGAPLFGVALQAPLAAILGGGFDVAAQLDAALAPLASVSAIFLLVMAAIAALIVARRRLAPVETAAAPQPTWGCGYAAPSPRMQYTGSSYARSLVLCCRALLRSRRAGMAPQGCFAGETRLSTQTADAAVELAYRPAFLAIARGCARLWPLQHGRVQLYLLYIVATLLLVFAAEAWLTPRTSAATQKARPAAAHDVRRVGPTAGAAQGVRPVP